jgi:hypothetical protein
VILKNKHPTDWTPAFPTEPRRLLNSHDIANAGVGISTDLPVIWNDLGSDMNNVVDCGLIAKLLFAEKYKETSFTNLSLQQSVEDVLQHTISKDSQKTDWKGDKNSNITKEQKECKCNDREQKTDRLTINRHSDRHPRLPTTSRSARSSTS